MLKVQATATVTYTCYLKEEDTEKVLNYIKDNSEEFELMSAEEKIIKAVSELDSECEIELYDNYTESDSITESIEWSSFEQDSAEDILKRGGIDND